MTSSSAILSILETAERSLVAPHYDLSLAWRYEIWKALGPGDRPVGVTGEGHRRRARLAILGAGKVLPLWERWRRGDLRPRRMLELAERRLQTGEQPPDDEDLEYFDVELDNLHAATKRAAVLVGYAALHAYRVAVEDHHFDADETPDPADYDEPDPARDAAIAYANGLPGEAGSDGALRREFWLWWLREAVPAAADPVRVPPK